MSLRTQVAQISLLALIASCSVAFAQLTTDTCQEFATTEDCFKEALNRFCAPAGGASALPPAVCNLSPELKESRRTALGWLALEEACGGPSARADVCALFRAVQSRKPAFEPLVLAYDHTGGAWSARNQLGSSRIDKDVAGSPTVSLAPNEELIVVVEGTNPVLYTVTPGTATEVDTPELEEIKKLAGLLGGGLQALTTSLATSAAESMMAAMETAGSPNPIEAGLKSLQKGIAKVNCTLGRVTDQTSRAGHFIQRLELGGDAQYPLLPGTQDCENGPAKGLENQSDAAFEFLAIQMREAVSPEDLCLSFFQAAESAFGGDFKKPGEIRAAILDAEAAFALCSEPMRPVAETLLSGPLAEMKKLIDTRPQPADLAQKLGALGDENLGIVKQLSAVIARYKELHAGATTLLAKRDEIRKAAAQVDQFENRLASFLLAQPAACTGGIQGDCVFATAISRHLVLPSEPKPVRWDKIQKHSVKIAANAPLATTAVPGRPAPVEAPYSLDSVARGLWGIGASMIYTPLRNPTFTAVSDGGNPAKFTLTRTDEETRAGEIALLVDYGLGRRLCPKCLPWVRAIGIEFGAGIDSDKPAFFAGPSFRIGRHVRLGAGVTYQQVQELDGQELGQLVKSADDVSTRDTFKADYYISLSVALESISLFSSGD